MQPSARRYPMPYRAPTLRLNRDRFLFAVLVSLCIAGAAQAQVISDDFKGGSLNPIWTFANPLSDGSFKMTGSHVEITAPTGNVHNAFDLGNTLPRIMQTAVGNPDFQAVVKFESNLNGATVFKTQGMLLEQLAATDFIRIEFLGTSTGPKIFVATIQGGTPNVLINTDITVTAPMFLRVSRTGDNFTVEWSGDGVLYNPAAAFAHAMTVNDISIYAGSSASESHTARADFFFETASPISPEDDGQQPLDITISGPGTNSVTRIPDRLTFDFGQSVELTPVSGITSAFDAWSGDLTGSAVPETLTMDAPKSVTATFIADGPQPMLTSDDFKGATLNPVWTFVDPLSDGSFKMTGSHVEITAPTGNVHNADGSGNTLPRIEQAVSDVDFEIDVKWESDVNATTGFQTQGILLQETATNVVRIEFLDVPSSGPRVFVATIFNGSFVTIADVSVNVTPPMYLRVTRVRASDNINVEYSVDGLVYVQVTNFTKMMTVNDISIYAGAGAAGSHTARADFFFETASPISPEDDGQQPLDIAIAGPGANSVARIPDRLTFDTGQSVQLTPVWDVGTSFFDAWSGDLTGSVFPETLTMDAAKSVTATFTTGVVGCGNGILEGVEVCDLGTANGTTSCCSATCDFSVLDTVCRASSDLCDAAEVCSGLDAVCPADVLAPALTECRASAGLCDVADVCSGTDAACPADQLLPAATECRASAGACDVADVCSGTNAACPADQLLPAATECRASAGVCDVADVCSGTDATCPADQLLPAATECRASAGVCDVADVCSGTDATCPADQLLPAATECRASAGLCDVADVCSGTDATCPADQLLPAATECRASAGACDVADVCSGTDATCPADQLLPAATECRASAGLCDVADVCSGTNAACPVDQFASAATECRASAGACDVADVCSGTDATCPADQLLPAATECRASAGLCDVADVCSGTDAACPADQFASAATQCRASAGFCDLADFCPGTNAACPVDQFVPAATECRASAGACDVADVCSGTNAACPVDQFASAATQCRASAGACDVADFCSGAGAACPTDEFASAATECRSATGPCDVTELCSGTGTACPADEIAVVDTVCRGAADDCDVDEVCNGVDSNCPADQLAAVDTVCSSGDECLMEELCDGGGLCLGGRLSVPAPVSCPVIDNSLFFTDVAQDVVVQGNLVYVAALSAGLRIVDFIDPAIPVEVAFYDPPTCLDNGIPVPFEAEDVVLSGAFLLVSAGPCGVLVFDSNAATLIDNNTIPIAIDTSGNTFAAQPVGGGEIFAADFDGGLAVLNLSTEQQIDSFGAGSTLLGSVDIELDGSRAILATGPGLRIVEGNSQAGFVLASFYDSGNETTGPSQDVELTRDGVKKLAYLARAADGLDVLDISDPTQITFLKNMPSVAGSFEVSISGSRAVTAEGTKGIGVLDLSNPSLPVSLGTFPSAGITFDVEMNDSFAFVASETAVSGMGGLRIVQLERIGVDPQLVPEPATILGNLTALTALATLAWRRRNQHR